MSNAPINDFNHARFDQAVQGHHAASVARLSPQVRAQLVQRRHAATRGEPVKYGRHGLRTGVAAFATLCALAIGLQLRPAALPGNTTSTSTAVASVAANGRALVTMLDEDPEFYAWLASPDAQQVAME